MKLISITEFLDRWFVGNYRPSTQTIKRKIINGEIAGARMGESGSYYVDIEAYEKKLQAQGERDGRDTQTATSPEGQSKKEGQTG